MNTQISQTPERFPINLEQALAVLACALALALRFLNLGTAPLSDAEARWALQSLTLADSTHPTSQLILGAQPAYIFMTSWLFQLFGATNFLARFWPALAGCSLILVPLLFRRQLSRSAALIAAFGLAVDPGLVTVSRQAGGPMMSLAFGLLALGTWNNRKHLLAGVLAGLALLSGPALIQGALGFGIAWFAYRLVGDNSKPDMHDAEIGAEEASQPVTTSAAHRSTRDSKVRTAIIAMVLTILVVGTSFFRYPQGLAAWTQTLATYLEGLTKPSGTNPFTLLAALGIFQPLALIFTIICILRWLVKQNSSSLNTQNTIWLLVFWLFASLIFALFYPARQITDLVWVLVPLWGLAAIELGHFLPEGKPNIVSLLQAILVLILAALLWNTLISTSQLSPVGGSSPATIRLVLLLGILLLGSLTTILIGLGWNWEISQNGLVWGITSTCLVYSISVLWGAALLRPNQPSELWGVPPGTGQVDLLVSTIEDISDRQTGLPQFIQIQSTVDNPSLRWALHTFPDTQFTSILPSEDMPAVLITTQEQTAPVLTTAYRGQDFTWRVLPGWTGVLPDNFIDWLTFRQAPVINEQIILWVRSDLFPGAAQGGQN
jgi:uncharacterized protein (TIGR03663 family)